MLSSGRRRCTTDYQRTRPQTTSCLPKRTKALLSVDVNISSGVVVGETVYGRRPCRSAHPTAPCHSATPRSPAAATPKPLASPTWVRNRGCTTQHCTQVGRVVAPGTPCIIDLGAQPGLHDPKMHPSRRASPTSTGSTTAGCTARSGWSRRLRSRSPTTVRSTRARWPVPNEPGPCETRGGSLALSRHHRVGAEGLEPPTCSL